MGDRDFIPLVEAIKNSGKKTICFTHKLNSSDDLLAAFDMRVYFVKDTLDALVSSSVSIASTPP